MVSMDALLMILYVVVDDFCESQLLEEKRSGPAASLSHNEVVTLAIFSQWSWFRNQRDFYRFVLASGRVVEVSPVSLRDSGYERRTGAKQDFCPFVLVLPVL